MNLDLNRLEQRLNETLSKETTKSLNEWLNKKRMNSELKIQLLRRSCCNTIFAGCVEPYCYTDEDWLKSLKEYVDNGCVVEYVEAGQGLQFEKCKCGDSQLKINI